MQHSSAPVTGKNSTHHIAQIQYLRGIAAMAVVLGHITLAQSQIFADFAPVLPVITGFWGVDLFFVISGFIIIHITADLPAGSAEAISFFKQRLIRIVPAYWFYTLLSVVISVVAGLAVYSLGDVVKSLLFIKAGWPVLMVGWTLTYEMLFYMLFGFFVLIFDQKKRMAAVMLCLASLALFGAMTDDKKGLLQYYANPIILEFIAGMVIGFFYSESSEMKSAPLLAMILGSLAILIADSLFDVDALVKYRVIVWGISAALIVWGAVHLKVKNTFRILKKMGDISYSMYLCHVPIMGCVAIVVKEITSEGESPVPLFVGLTTVLVFIVSELSYKIIECRSSLWLKKTL